MRTIKLSRRQLRSIIMQETRRLAEVGGSPGESSDQLKIRALREYLETQDVTREDASDASDAIRALEGLRALFYKHEQWKSMFDGVIFACGVVQDMGEALPEDEDEPS